MRRCWPLRKLGDWYKPWKEADEENQCPKTETSYQNPQIERHSWRPLVDCHDKKPTNFGQQS
jgi:hypothetical protein